MIYQIRRMKRDDWNEVAELIYHSLNEWYRIHRGIDPFVQTKESMLVFPRIYESLDPGCCVVAVDPESSRIAATSFFHPRETHISLGILNSHPHYWGKGAAGVVLDEICHIAQERKLPLRLVSSAVNFESFNLYNSRFFVPFAFFQDMSVKVPASGFDVVPPAGEELSDATMDDATEMADLEYRLCGIRRENDLRYFIENSEGIWRTSISRNLANGRITGFCASVCDPGSNMVGPGCAESESTAAALIKRELNRYHGRSPVWLIPSNALELRREMFNLGARNAETHIAQICGGQAIVRGIMLPSFMPETC